MFEFFSQSNTIKIEIDRGEALIQRDKTITDKLLVILDADI